MPLFFWLIVFVVALIALIKAADYFNMSAEDIGLSLKISPFTIGLVLLSIGTSLPELASSVVAVLADATEVVSGNVVGSNIANIFLVLGLAAIIYKKPVEFEYKRIRLDMIFLLIASLFLVLAFSFYTFVWWEGLIGLALFAVYMTLISKKNKRKDNPKPEHKLKKKSLIIFPASIVLLYLGAKYTIESLIIISETLSVAREAIAAGAIALATSLPELFVSLDALKKGKNDMAAGNIIGSCVFNAFIVMGIPSFIGQLDIPATVLLYYMPVMLVATLSIFIISYRKITMNKWVGALFFLAYLAFMVYIFIPTDA